MKKIPYLSIAITTNEKMVLQTFVPCMNGIILHMNSFSMIDQSKNETKLIGITVIVTIMSANAILSIK